MSPLLPLFCAGLIQYTVSSYAFKFNFNIILPLRLAFPRISPNPRPYVALRNVLILTVNSC